MRKKVGLISVLIISLIVVFLLFYNKETTLIKEGFASGIDVSNVNEIEITRSSDSKQIVIKDEEAKELMNKFLNANLKETRNASGDLTESYWMHIKADGDLVFGVVIDDRLILSPFDSNRHKKNSEDYLLENDSILNNIEAIFE